MSIITIIIIIIIIIIIVVVIINTIVLVSHDIVCFGYFMPMGHGVNKKPPPIASPGLFFVSQEILYQPHLL